MIRNTEKDAKDPANALLMLAASMGPGGSDQAIAEQERAGQAQLVNSEQLPTDLNGDGQADFEALGFDFGDVTPGDSLFRAATLPDGWKREASDHDMWSYVVDQLGRRRVGVFYKAAFYDRKAHMNLVTLDGYVSECQYHDRDVITDATWATPAAVAEAARRHAQRAQGSIDDWTRIAEDRGAFADSSGRYIAEFTAERNKYEAIAVQFEAVTDAR